MYGNLKRGEDTEQMGVIDWANWNLQRLLLKRREISMSF